VANQKVCFMDLHERLTNMG